ncbi:unnamed protein product [Polarella glacialis]|uniref:25S rRNA (uridine-N(3))-methyltransferase BMT5-like domain-containing protein n=1 Tax=Polarella glacialis TaxID=89957 RepID=A0A813HLX7_POLGL|nr:unnamed protein product [Polarella glacialis]
MATYEDGSLEAALQAAEAGEIVEAEAEEEEVDDDDEGVQEHLKDAVEGTLRLKRMLSQDDEAPEFEELGGKKKKAKIVSERSAEDEAKITQLLTQWALLQDRVTRHVLEGMTGEEMTAMIASGYAPDHFNQWKSPPELVHTHVALTREKVGPGSGAVDTIVAFRARWKLGPETEPVLRKLSHKDLRYVVNRFNGGEFALEELVAQAATAEHEESTATGALPDAPGCAMMGRFGRLELIDPLADCAVFGDADLSFAVKLAKHRTALGHVGRVIATTFETLECLRERYSEIDDTIKTLEDHFAEVFHGVDCTRIAVNENFKGLEGKFGCVYYNFPHAGAVKGFFDGHPCVNWRHENLMRLFFRALRSFMKPGGLVKVSSSKQAVGIRYYYICDGALQSEFQHIETVPFQEWHLSKYNRSYGDKRDAYRRPEKGEGYNVQRAEFDMLYCFKYEPSGNAPGPVKIRMPPKFGVLAACTDGPFKSLVGEGKKALATQLYKRFVTEISGEHVG